MNIRFFLYCLGLAFLSPILKAEAVSIRASCTPNPLAARSVATYTIVVTGSSQVSQPSFPSIRGLDIQFLGKGHSVQIINGQKRSELRLNYALKTDAPGTYTLPSLSLRVDQKDYQLPPLDLTVLPSSEHALLKQSGISLRLEIEPTLLYEGQSLASKVILSVPAGIQGSILSDKPELLSPGFSPLQGPPVPTDSQKEENGQLFQEIAWDLRIKSKQAGKHSLSYQLPLSLRIQSTKSALQSFFDQSLLDPLALFQAQDETVLLESQEVSLEVLELPKEGKPANFSGYIGTLSAQKVDTSLMDPEVGDPVTLKLILRGSGDLQALPAPTFAQDKRIKAYPPKEEILNQASSGEMSLKSLEYIVIAQEAGNLSLPPLEINFFNPQSQRYETLSCPIPPLSVQAPKTPYKAPIEERAQVQAPSKTQDLQENQALSGPKMEEPNIASSNLQARLGTLRPSILPSLLYSRLYWWGQGGVFSLGLAALLYRWLSQLKQQKALTQQGAKTLDRLLEQAREAALEGKEAEFFDSLYAILSLPCLHLSQEISLKNLETFLTDRPAPPEILSTARYLWDLREGYAFGGGSLGSLKVKGVYQNLETFATYIRPCLT